MTKTSNLKPLVVVVTRTKNRNFLLKRALESVKNQTYKNFVHVIVNDGGDIKSVDGLVKQYQHNIKVIHNKASVGLTKALNQGIKAVDTKYVTILDDDDTWSVDRLEKTIRYLEETGLVGVVCVMDRIVEEIDGEKVKKISKARIYEGLTSISLYRQCLDNYMTNGCFTYRRDVYRKLDGYDERLAVAEDWDFGIRFLLMHDVAFLPTKSALHFYHHRPTAKGDVGNSVFDRVDEHRKLLNVLSNHYLRKDINSGTFGVGYIMNSLLYRKDTVMPYEEKRSLNQTIRLEGHINFATEQLKKQLEEFIRNEIKSNMLHNKIRSRLRSK